MKQIFLVEDDLSLVSGLSFAMKKQGYAVTVARTSMEAEQLWRTGTYDLVVLDVSLPDGCGFDLCQTIRQTSKVPIMFLTAADEETDIIMGLDLGGDDYLTLALAACSTLFSGLLLLLPIQNAAVYILAAWVCVGIGVLIMLYLHFKRQDAVMETAISQMQAYLAGNHEIRLDGDEEGELYRLFHEINSLVSILNAHAENERRAKYFLKDTIADISHQLKTPLAALNIYNGILQEDPAQLETVQEFTALSEQELDRIDTLVQNLLKITKLDAGTVVLEKSSENLAELMAQVEQHFAFRAKQEGKLLSFSGSSSVQFLCDSSWLMEAVGNIVKNALDHTEAGNTIRVTWRELPAVIQIMVTDNGTGIHPEDLPHIFKRFYRSRFSKDTQGIGLGLPLVKMIVEAHSGTIEVDSELGIGTTFVMNFLIPTKL